MTKSQAGYKTYNVRLFQKNESENMAHQVRIGLKLPSGNVALSVMEGEDVEAGYYKCCDVVCDFMKANQVDFKDRESAEAFGEVYRKLFYMLSERRHVPLKDTEAIIKERKGKFYVVFDNKYNTF